MMMMMMSIGWIRRGWWLHSDTGVLRIIPCDNIFNVLATLHPSAPWCLSHFRSCKSLEHMITERECTSFICKLHAILSLLFTDRQCTLAREIQIHQTSSTKTQK